MNLHLLLKRVVYSLIASLLLITEGSAIAHNSIAFGSKGNVLDNSSRILNEHSRTSTVSNISTQIEFVPPPSDGSPDQTRGAGARDERRCPQDVAIRSIPSSTSAGLSALVPPDNYGLTYMEHPIFWVYLPQTSAQRGIISLREEGGRPHAQLAFDLPAMDSIIGVQLPETLPPLESGKNYQWAIVLVCGSAPRPSDPVVTAWIRREPGTLPNANSLNPVEQANWYSQHGIWYDALTALAQSRQSSPEDVRLTRLWINFLSQPQVNMEAIANAPLFPLILP